MNTHDQSSRADADDRERAVRAAPAFDRSAGARRARPGVCSLVALRRRRSRQYTERQGIYFAVGFVVMTGLSRIDYSRLRELKYGLYAILIGSILLVLGVGRSALGATRAISSARFLLPGVRARQGAADRVPRVARRRRAAAPVCPAGDDCA